jgi:hypothetical protein
MSHEFGPEIEEQDKKKDKRIALLISVLALFLALSEVLGKSAQTEALTANVQANDLWAFYQAKTIRMTVLRTAAQIIEVELPDASDQPKKQAIQKLIDNYKKTADRYESDPEKHEGRKELEDRAHESEKARDLSLAQYHHYEIASAALQIGIVLASASILVSVGALAWLGGGLGAIGTILMAVGFFAPETLHGLHML